MDEAAVFASVATELDRRGYDALVHVPPPHADQYSEALNQFPSHSITIQGRYPDILGFSQRNRVFAIEVKGDSALQKGVGQALTYQQGVHYSYLAAADPAVSEVSDLALSKGLGIIGVEETGDVAWETPHETLNREFLPDVEGQLAYRLRQRESAGRIAAMSLAQPLNFLAPPLAIATLDELSREAVVARIERDYEFRATSGALDGAEVLGLIETEPAFQLTNQGKLTTTVLRGAGIRTLEDLNDLKDRTRGSTLNQESPVLGQLLRNLFMQHPEMQLFVEALASFNERPVYFPDLLERLVTQYPNLYLNLFCTTQGRETARTYLQRGELEPLYADPGVWKDVVRNNVLFNFVHQLRHAGILAAETNGHGTAISEYDPDETPWHLGQVLLER